MQNYCFFYERFFLRFTIICFIIFFILSCSSKKVTLIHHEEPEFVPTDTISNYFLFDYIKSLSEDDYYIKLDSIKNRLSSDFFALRMAYTHTDNYSPYGIDESDSLKKASELIDSSKFDSAILVLNRVYDTNFVSIPAHLYLGYIYNQLGDSVQSNFHYYIYNGLLNSIYQSGDGQSPETAYIVISTKEEYNFLSWFNLQVNSQSLVAKDAYSFDLMKVTDKNSGGKFEIYFNIELAFSLLRDTFSK